VFRYDDGTSAIFSTCANPDADPLGHWCQVDPNKCDNFATILKNGDQVRREAALGSATQLLGFLERHMRLLCSCQQG
jgi:hypothetical protein